MCSRPHASQAHRRYVRPAPLPSGLLVGWRPGQATAPSAPAPRWNAKLREPAGPLPRGRGRRRGRPAAGPARPGAAPALPPRLGTLRGSEARAPFDSGHEHARRCSSSLPPTFACSSIQPFARCMPSQARRCHHPARAGSRPRGKGTADCSDRYLPAQAASLASQRWALIVAGTTVAWAGSIRSPAPRRLDSPDGVWTNNGIEPVRCCKRIRRAAGRGGQSDRS